MKLVPAGVSRRTGKKYNAFNGCKIPSCKETAPAVNEPEETINVDEEFEEEMKKGDYTSQGQEEVEDKPMTRLDWNHKEFIKGLGVFSSAARSEGMNPPAAFENMAIWEWMDVAYGDLPGYESWKARAKTRIK